ncbi:dihydrolipoyl dehydrogenase family protein [Streptococcus loxodontisalivarius]|uniref:Glutathione reductase (NADPH) n=1 Tax=Streptococcus loxodontisalivarius TaxID=1349415 RepID=A0ABS2PR93_9STRE|nr:NAD(P)/FAD-dependent oxidoreductase [Streptococcus loxodontisalivarius]MBM7642458.1 glutathione reductase (NADPH) [Streptococcus loxodontisalivarius]
MYQYDVTFIGSGHASWHAAVTLAQAGKKIAIIEKDVTAGTCTNYGCNAKFLLESPFEFMDGLARYEKAGIAKAGEISWEKLMVYKKEEISSYAPFMEGMFDHMNIDLIRAHGQLKDAHTVLAGDQELTTDYVVIGTGQRPARLNVPGNEHFHDSRDFLDLDKMPKRLVFIGAGIISLEFATMAAKLGSEVHIIEFADRALAAYPENYVATVIEKMTEEGVTFHFGQAVSEAQAISNGYLVKTAAGLEIETDYIIDATGRVSNVEGLGLEDLGIETDRLGIKVNDHMQTAVPTIFASGDVVSKTIPKLTPTASFESDYIASVILGNQEPIKYPVVPNIVFAMPRIAQVGVTVEQARENADDDKIVEVPFGQQLKFQTKLEAESHFTLIVGKDKKLKGAALMSNEAGEMINLITLIINQGLTAQDLNQMIFAFPAVTNGLLNSLKSALA